MISSRRLISITTMSVSEVEQSIKLYQQGYSAAAICKEVGYTPHTILKALRESDIIIRGKGGYCAPWNERYFQDINTERKAYFLGYLMADGNVTIRHNSQPSISLEIHEKDKYILNILKEELQTNNSVNLSCKGRTTYLLRVHSSLMAKDLAKYGVVPHKTGIEQFPILLLKEEFIQHFIRGFFDGDGWFSISHYGDYSKMTIGFAKNVIMLTDIRNYLYKNLGVTLVKVHEYNDLTKGYPGYGMLMFTKRQNVLDIGNFMYKDATIFLDRKYEIYKKMLTIPRGRIGRPRRE